MGYKLGIRFELYNFLAWNEQILHRDILLTLFPRQPEISLSYTKYLKLLVYELHGIYHYENFGIYLEIGNNG